MKWILVLLFPLLSFSQDDYIENFKKLSHNQQVEEVKVQIANLESLYVWNYIKELQDNDINLKDYSHIFIEKAERSLWPLDIHCLITILIEQQTDKQILENILTSKKEIWDKGEWSEKFWQLIRENNFIINEGQIYTINEYGGKNYRLEEYLAEKVKHGEIGSNPILFIDYQLVPYTADQLLRTLKKLDIRDIQIIPKDRSVSLYGKSGIDGVIKVLIRK